MKSELQASFAKMLLEQAVTSGERRRVDDQDVQTIETLRTLPLPTAILQSFVEGLPTVSSGLPDKAPASKRRRTSHGQSTNTAYSDANKLLSIIRHITIVLELVEGSEPERHPELFKGLFHVFSDLQHASSRSYMATDYLQLLAMDSMLAIVKKVEVGVTSSCMLLCF
jgi:U3 small nucleolar RNA-associated protein 10